MVRVKYANKKKVMLASKLAHDFLIIYVLDFEVDKIT